MSWISKSIERGELSKFKLDRFAVSKRVASWSAKSEYYRGEAVVKVYKRTPQPFESDPEPVHAWDYIRHKHEIGSIIRIPEYHESDYEIEPEREEEKVRLPEVSREEAEKISDEMIKSYSHNHTMRELLEAAKYFAGPNALVGAPASRRARRATVNNDGDSSEN